jgi:hypothetical protein
MFLRGVLMCLEKRTEDVAENGLAKPRRYLRG